MLIDWISCAFYCVHEKINAGQIISVNPDGTLEYEIDKRKQVPSYSTSVSIRSAYDLNFGPCDDPKLPNVIYISGNPAKWLNKGHNFFFDGDIDFTKWVKEVLDTAGVIYRSQLHFIPVRISRLDLTLHYDLKNNSNVNRYLHHTMKHARSRNGTSLNSGNTVYFNKTSRRWTIKMYNKLEESLKHPPLESMSNLMQFVTGHLRVELTLRSKEIEQLGIRNYDQLKQSNLFDIFLNYMSRLSIPKNANISVDGLTRSQVMAFHLWRSGEDLRALYSRPQFYKHRSALLPRGVDISTPPTEAADLGLAPEADILYIDFRQPCRLKSINQSLKV